MLWDVDPVGMTTTFFELHTQLSETVEFSAVISHKLGFGNQLDIPFTLHLNSFSSDAAVTRGPFSIGLNLQFEMNGQGIGTQDITMNVAGYVDMEGEQFDFDANPPSTHTDACIGEFDDSGYPQQLELRLNVAGGFNWGGHDYYRILQTSVEGHIVELHANPHHVEANNWTGQLIPEPATLSLLALGGLAVMRRRRR